MFDTIQSLRSSPQNHISHWIILKQDNH